MPAVNFKVRWPDGETAIYYSPSTIIHQFFKENETCTVSEFDKKVSSAMDQASERVKAKFGYYCSAASGEKSKIKTKLLSLNSEERNGNVTVVGFE